MDELPWRLLQLGLVDRGRSAGWWCSRCERRFEALVLGLILLYVTAVAALLIASPRRALITLPLVAALAGVGITWVVSFARERAGPGCPPPDLSFRAHVATPLARPPSGSARFPARYGGRTLVDPRR